MRPSDPLREKAGAVKIIICDLDGTLLDSQKLISPGNLAALKAVRERGIFVTICSGRIPSMMEAYIRLLEIRCPLIGANGAIIASAPDGEILYRRCAGGTASQGLLEFSARRGFDHVAATARGCYYSRGSERIKRFEQYNTIARRDGLEEIPLQPFDSGYAPVAGMEIYKMLISGLSPEEQRETEAYIDALETLGYTSSEARLLDVGPAGVNKGTGVQNLARIMGLSREEICVFGDYSNDIPMFEAAGFSVAMGNAGEELKSRAVLVTGTNDEDGVAAALRSYFL